MARKTQTDPPRIFISYSRQDAVIMRRVEERLKAASAEVWVDHAGIRSGDNLPKRISDALEWCNILLLLWSVSAKKSKWVEKEWTNAEALERKIIPCLLDATPRPGILASKVYVDFREVEKGLAELLHSLGLSKPLATAIAVPLKRKQRIDHGRLTETRVPKPQPQPILRLRSQPQVNFSMKDVQKMLEELGFFDIDKNKNGKGLRHEYEKIERHGHRLVIDHTTALTWQQCGSTNEMTYAAGETYISELNRDNFGGYNNWHLPTLEEAMSLMEPNKNNEDLYIDLVFDKTQKWIWTADKIADSVAWVVPFAHGRCYDIDILNHYYVRAVH